MDEKLKTELKAILTNFKIVCSSAISVVFGAALFGMSFYFGSDADAHLLNVTIFVVALLLGWVVGILATPYDQLEHKDFTAYSKAISAFITGFVLAKADKAIEHVFAPETLGDPVVLFRLALFSGAFLIGLIITFVFRKYA